MIKSQRRTSILTLELEVSQNISDSPFSPSMLTLILVPIIIDNYIRRKEWTFAVYYWIVSIFVFIIYSSNIFFIELPHILVLINFD